MSASDYGEASSKKMGSKSLIVTHPVLAPLSHSTLQRSNSSTPAGGEAVSAEVMIS